jgi:hypothetical protein
MSPASGLLSQNGYFGGLGFSRVTVQRQWNSTTKSFYFWSGINPLQKIRMRNGRITIAMTEPERYGIENQIVK